MTQQNSSRFGTAFTESVEAREGVTTGISAADRAHTIRVAIDPRSTSADLVRPGHVFPLRARRGGVLVRAGQTEASVDLARLAGLTPAGVICEIMRDDGAMARIPDLIPFCREHGLRILTVAELIRYRLRNERTIVRAGETRVQTRYGEFRMIAYESQVQGGESHIALVRGDLCPNCHALHGGPAEPIPGPLPIPASPDDGGVPPGPSSAVAERPGIAQPFGEPQRTNPRPACPHPVLVRVHTRCTAGDVFAADCRCREILDQSMRMIAEEGCGVILYLHNTSRGFAIDHTPAATNSAFNSEGSTPATGLSPAALGSSSSAMTISGGQEKNGRLILHQELRAREGSQDRSGRILRAIGLGGQILSDLGIQRIRLLSNTPMHIPALEGFGLEIVEQVPIPVEECARVG
jgi:3,4-dihydroxy 2-butanone 4-phosphate synthase/GTP cyclohydrolase II